MSENKCGDCRHWGLYVPSTREGVIAVGTCENVKYDHYRHVLSADHPAPPCFEGKAKRARLVSTKCSCRTPAKCTCLKAAQNASFTALDDIKKGEAVVIVK